MQRTSKHSNHSQHLRRVLLSWGGLIVAGLICSSQASLAQTKSEPVLTLSGKLGDIDQKGQFTFDMAALQALPQKTFTTATPWDVRPVKFTGPLLRDVLSAAQAKGQQLTAIAVNDYKIRVPVEDATKFDVIIAIKMNDKDIPARTKGPLFLIYPFSSRSELDTSVYHARSIWQLKTLQVQ
jgi:hypothetical protein